MKLRILDDNGIVWIWDLTECWLKVEGDETEGGGYEVHTGMDVWTELSAGFYIEG
jgi:hypothetical protein